MFINSDYIRQKIQEISGIKSLESGIKSVEIRLQKIENASENISDLCLRLSREDTAKYVMKVMPKATALRSPGEMIDFSISKVSYALKDGLFLEFGVWKGSSINRIAELISGPVYGFDSFEGLPETWRTGYEEGHFSLTTDGLPVVKENVVLIKGWFSDTLLDFKKKASSPIAFLHVDCDLYSSTKTIFDKLWDCIRVGTIILFDEYFGYPSWELHEFKAFQEFVESRQVTYEYIAYNEMHEQVAVRITSISLVDT